MFEMEDPGLSVGAVLYETSADVCVVLLYWVVERGVPPGILLIQGLFTFA